MTETPAAGYLRIGELARRSGVSPELLRAWERRYGLLRPSRSAGGFRLYADDDERRIRLMNDYLGAGLSAAEAARRALSEPVSPVAAPTGLAETAGALVGALKAYDETTANELLDASLATFGAETVVGEVISPALRTIGERWERDTLTVAQEHFASHVLRGRLLGLARGWGRGVGPVAVLACPPGEQHDLPLVMLGLALRAHGWRIAFLGADTPVATLERAAAELEPRAVVVGSTLSQKLQAARRELAALAATAPVFVGGAGVTEGFAGRTRIGELPQDIRAAAAQLTADLLR